MDPGDRIRVLKCRLNNPLFRELQARLDEVAGRWDSIRIMISEVNRDLDALEEDVDNAVLFLARLEEDGNIINAVRSFMALKFGVYPRLEEASRISISNNRILPSDIKEFKVSLMRDLLREVNIDRASLQRIVNIITSIVSEYLIRH